MSRRLNDLPLFENGTHLCIVFDCSGAGNAQRPAAETHWAIVPQGESVVWPVCEDCNRESRAFDKRHYKLRRLLYLPIVKNVMGSDSAVCVEVFMHAVCRLLRLRDGSDAADADLRLLRAAQAEAVRRKRLSRFDGEGWVSWV